MRTGLAGTQVRVTEPTSEALREGLKRVAVSLKEIGHPYALTGGYAAWALGAPENAHDVDFLVHPDDVDAIVEQLRERGLEVEHPPEDWLVKVRTDGVVVDLLHRANGFDVGEGLARADTLHVLVGGDGRALGHGPGHREAARPRRALLRPLGGAADLAGAAGEGRLGRGPRTRLPVRRSPRPPSFSSSGSR